MSNTYFDIVVHLRIHYLIKQQHVEMSVKI